MSFGRPLCARSRATCIARSKHSRANAQSWRSERRSSRATSTEISGCRARVSSRRRSTDVNSAWKRSPSNPGHCLWSQILSPARAHAVAERLVSPELFSGWGIRTLSTRAINYDPRSYHNGSVWPHDNAIAAAGLRFSGFPAEAEVVARATLESGMAYADRRLPELFSGAERVLGKAPEDYEASCRPQNWGAASAFQMIHTLLGLEADATRGVLKIAPVETGLWRRIEVSGLHFGGHRLDFSVDGGRGQGRRGAARRPGRNRRSLNGRLGKGCGGGPEATWPPEYAGRN